MAIQMRRGEYDDFDASKMLAGELAVVVSGDPETEGGALYVATAAGSATRVAFANEVPTEDATTTSDGLMSAADKAKLDGVAAGAQANVIESISVNGTAVDVNNKNAAISIPQASSDSAGLMAASDKTKLNGIEAGANAYTLPTATTNALGGVKPDGTTVMVDNDGTIHAAGSGTIPDGSITGVKIADDTIPDAKLAQTGGVLEKVAEISESTRNIFDPKYLITKAGWTLADGVYSGTAVKLHQNFNTSPYYPISGFEENTRYTFSLTAKTDGNAGTSGAGPMFRFLYSDGTNYAFMIPNSTTEYADFKWTSGANKTVVGFQITYGGNGDNIWYFKDIQMEEGTEKTKYIQHITAVDNIARADIGELESRVMALEDDVDTSMVVPSYYESNLSSAIATAQSAMTSASINGETFVFLSDIHWENNEKHSPALIKAVTSTLPIENTVFGGDTFNGGTQAAMVEIMNDVRQRFVKASPHFLSVYGNHDGNQLDGGVAFTNDEFYTYMQKQADYYVTYEAPCYYYMDNETTKTRYIVLDTRTTTPSTASAQLAWLQTITASAGAGWHFIVFCHVIFYPDSGGSLTDPTTWVMSQFMTDVLAALDAVNTGGSSKVEAIFGGHCHQDYNTQTQGGIPIVLIDCDTKQTSSGNPQTAGTVNEQCLDIVTVNYSSETITCARIGRGTSRTISY